MKLPFDFGPKFVFRLALPGIVLSAATAPVLLWFLRQFSLEAHTAEAVAVSAVFWGWFVTLADSPIYMLFEGRRYWPPPISRFFVRREGARMARLVRAVEERRKAPDSKTSNQVAEARVDLLDFPVDRMTGRPAAWYPTRLGNLMTAYETYTWTRYGLDAIFYWPRLWAILDKDLRGEIDEQQAVVDSAVYVSFAFYVSAVLLACYAVAAGLGYTLPRDPSATVLALCAVACVLAAYGIYRMTLYKASQYGELFRGLFDVHRKRLDFDDVVDLVDGIQGTSPDPARKQADRYRMVTRYLRFRMLTPPGERRSYTPEEWTAVRKGRPVRRVVSFLVGLLNP